MNGPTEFSSHSWAEAGGNCQRRLALRQAARTSWIRMDNSSRLRRAVLAKARPGRGNWLPGTQVYYWKRAGKSGKSMRPGKARQDPDRWVGPAIVLSQEGTRAVWITCRGQLLKMSPEHLRLATAEECLAQTAVLDMFKEQNSEQDKDSQKEKRDNV